MKRVRIVHRTADRERYDYQPCFGCGKSLKPEFFSGKPGDEMGDHPPDCAVVFQGHGNYGSQIWDPVGGRREWLEIHICDECLKAHSNWVKRVEDHSQRSNKYCDWDPYEQENIT